MDNGQKPIEASETFFRRLVEVQTELYSFLSSLAVGRQDVDDLLQDTDVALLRHASEYDEARPFLPWAKSFAFNQLRRTLTEEKRDALVFDDDLLQKLAEERMAEDDSAEENARLALLENCLKKLSPAQLRLIDAHYWNRQTAGTIAGKWKRSVTSVHVQLHRIRALLRDCITRKLAAEEKGES